MSRADHYVVLGVERAATAEEIKAAWHRARTTLHPDRGGSPEAFRAARLAFDVLGEPSSRARYDGEAWIESLLRPPVRGEDKIETLTIPVLLSIVGGEARHGDLAVTVPPGVAVGDRLRCKGRGGPGEPPGDLLLEVAIGDAPNIWRVGDDVHVRLLVTWYEALRRGRFRLPTPWDVVETELPASVAAGGAELDIPNHGARPARRPWGRLVAHVELVPPRAEPSILLFLEAEQSRSSVRAELEAAFNPPGEP